MKRLGFCPDCKAKFREYEEYLYFCPNCGSRNVVSSSERLEKMEL